MKKRILTKKGIILIALIITVFDQVTKYLAISNLNPRNSITLIPHFIKLTLAKNTGAAFSLLNQNTNFLSFLSISVTIFLLLWILKNSPFKTLEGLGLGFILGGTIGNGIDRIRLNFVIDFFDFIPIDFPIFNIADISINIAVLFLLIESIKFKK